MKESIYVIQLIFLQLASYPGHVGGGKSGLVSTVCACAVMRRNNQPRYTACSVAAVFTRRWLPLSATQGVTRQGLRCNHRRFHRRCACSSKQTAESRSRWTYQIQ